MRKRRSAASPLMFAQMTLASWEVIARRAAMMAAGACSPAEYQRMVREKTEAAMQTGMALATGRATVTSLMSPWHSRSRANARRLRKG